VDRLLEDGFNFVVDADLESYFDSIPHEQMMARMKSASAMGASWH